MIQSFHIIGSPLSMGGVPSKTPMMPETTVITKPKYRPEVMRL
jgi:hypothetical protein